MMKKILILLPWLPYPLDSGGNQGVFHMIKAMLSAYEVHLWFLVDISVNKDLLEKFANALDHKLIIHYTIKKPGLNIATLRGIHYKVCKLLLRHDSTFNSNQILWGKETSSRFDDYILSDINGIIEKYSIDIVQVEFFPVIDYVYCLPSDVKKIFVHHELSFVRKQTQMKQLENKTAYDDFMLARTTDREIAVLNKYDAIIVLSEIDKEKLEINGVKTNIFVSPLFIPNSGYAEFIPAKNRIVMIGGGAHFPNIEGLRWFIDKIHPILSKQINYRLEVIGDYWDVNNLQNLPDNITFLGFVDDLSKVVPGSVMIVPILSGSGMRMKILESVNNSVPFVSTTIGVEGLSFVGSRDCEIADNPEVFANKISNLLRDTNLQRKYVMNSRKVYEDNYSSSISSQRRLAVLDTIINK